MTPRLYGISAALAALAADQASKLAVIRGLRLGERDPLALAPWLDLVMAWNPGISYSLFSTHGPLGWLALLAFTGVAAAALAVWLWRCKTRIGAVALGMILGAALGNGLDRAQYGRVADFIHLHLGGFSPFGVFNFADVCIFAGVGLLIYEAVFAGWLASRGAGS